MLLRQSAYFLIFLNTEIGLSMIKYRQQAVYFNNQNMLHLIFMHYFWHITLRNNTNICKCSKQEKQDSSSQSDNFQFFWNKKLRSCKNSQVRNFWILFPYVQQYKLTSSYRHSSQTFWTRSVTWDTFPSLCNLVCTAVSDASSMVRQHVTYTTVACWT